MNETDSRAVSANRLEVLIGSEGTLGIITAACLKLFPLPVESVTAWVGIPNPAAVVEVLARLRTTSGDSVSGFELLPRLAVQLTAHHRRSIPSGSRLPGNYAWYALVELSSSREGSRLQTVLHETLAAAAQHM